jgi:Periplasmic binding protein
MHQRASVRHAQAQRDRHMSHSCGQNTREPAAPPTPTLAFCQPIAVRQYVNEQCGGGLPETLTAMTAFASRMGYLKVDAITPDSPQLAGVMQSIAGPAMKAAGIDFTLTPVPTAGDPTERIRKALLNQPDAHMILGDTDGCAAILKALNALKSSAARLLVQPCLDDRVTQALGASLNGAYVFTESDIASDGLEAQLFREVLRRYSPTTPAAGFAVAGSPPSSTAGPSTPRSSSDGGIAADGKPRRTCNLRSSQGSSH